MKSLETEKYSLLGMRKIRYFQYTSNIYQNQAEYPVYIDLGSSDKTKQYYIVKSPDNKVKFHFLSPMKILLRNMLCHLNKKSSERLITTLELGANTQSENLFIT